MPSDQPVPDIFISWFAIAQQTEQRFLHTGDHDALTRAVEVWIQILEHPEFQTTPPDFRRTVLNDAGSTFLQRYQAQGRIADLDRALALWREAVQITPPDWPHLPSILSNLGTGLRARYARSGNLEDLNQAIAFAQQAVSITPLDSPHLPSRLTSLGNGLRDRYARTGRLEDLEQAIAVSRQALAATPPDSSNRAALLNNLGIGLRAQYERSGRLEDLEQAIAVLQQAVATTPPVSPNLPMYLANLGAGLSARYARSGRLEDLEQALAVLQQAVATTPPVSPNLPMYLNSLGNGLRDRYACTGRLEDLEQAIAVLQQAVAATPPDSPNLPMYLANMGNGLRDRYARTGRLEDLEEAIAVYQQAVATTPPGSPDLPVRLNNLGIGLRDRYARTGRLEDLEQAIAVYQQAVDTAPPDSPERPIYLTNLGIGLHDRYARSGSLEDLNRAIERYQQAVQDTPPGSPELPVRLTNLGTGLSDRYERSGRLEDLEQAIAVYQQAVDTAPPDSPDRPSILTNLGTGLRDRYARTGNLKDLNQAIELHRQAVQSTPPDSPNWPSRLNNLGSGLRARYAHTGQLEDLEQAIDFFQQAVRATLPDSPDQPSRLNNLGTGLSDRYARTGRLEDLEQAIDFFQQAVRATPPDSPKLPKYLTNLGTGLGKRYERTGRIEDLDLAIDSLRRSAEIIPPGSPDRPTYLAHLGNGLRHRYACTERMEDLEEAITLYQQAVSITPPDSPKLPMCLTNLGNGLSDRYAHTGRLADLEQARTRYAHACESGKLLAPEVALTASQMWGSWASARAAWEEAVEAFEHGVATVEQLHRAQARRGDQETWLNAARGLHMRAAYALVRAAGPGALRRAVEIAELGRARGLGETLARDRADLDLIEREHPAIYERYRAAADKVRFLERADQAEVQQDQPEAARFTDLAARIRAARAELDDAIAAIRAVPGYEGFLQPPSYAEIAATAQPGAPLVYLITTLQGSLALIVPHAAEPEALLLDDFTETDLDALLIERANDEVVGGYLPGQLLGGAALTTALERGLPRLGAALIAPLAARLRALSATGVTLIPTGLLSLLPLHAATYLVDGHLRCLLDEFDVAYAPSARVLATAQREVRRRANNTLRLAGVGNPTGDLHYAGTELASICDLLPAEASRAFFNATATRDALWQALPESTIAHFACHGQFNADDTLDSALLLAGDSRLTLRELVTGDTTALANVRLAVLSACQTAITDFQRVPDESIGLPGGFLQAGVPAVVGSLWSVNDLSTALLMHRFYELYLKGDPDAGLEPQPPARALRLAQAWLRDLTYDAMFAYFERHRQLRATQRLHTESAATSAARMPFDLIAEGRAMAEEGALDDPSRRPYADPVYWAAFTFNGALEGV